MSDDDVRAAFRKQAGFCEAMGAPMTATIARALANGLDRDSATGRAVLDWPGDPIGDALPLRLIGGLHALHREGVDVGFASGEVLGVGRVSLGCLAAGDELFLGELADCFQHREPGPPG